MSGENEESDREVFRRERDVIFCVKIEEKQEKIALKNMYRKS